MSMNKSKHMMVAAAIALMPPTLASGQEAPPGLTTLHDALRLRPDQEQAWQVFQRSSTRDSQDDARHRDAYQRMESLEAPQRMDVAIQLMRSDLNQLERRGDAMKAFYATLSPDQRETFNRETLRPPQ